MARTDDGSRVLLIGGTGGIGSALAQRLAQDGIDCIVAGSPASRQPETVDVSDLASVQALAGRLQGLGLGSVINCAGVNGNQPLFAPGSAQLARREIEVNYLGMLHVGLVFGPLLAARGGGSLVTVLSFLSHACLPALASYSASKAAAHSLNQALRAELAPRGVRVGGIYPTAIDTRMSQGLPVHKMPAAELADAIADFLQGDGQDLYPGEAAQARTAWLQDPEGFQKGLAAASPDA